MIAPGTPGWAELAARDDGSALIDLRAEFIDVAMRWRGRLVYLATPYTFLASRDGRFQPAGSDLAAREAARWAAHFAVNGLSVVSPVVQSAAMVDADPGDALDPLDAGFWEVWCRPLIRACAAVVVVPIAGWDRSHGVWCEAQWAMRHGRPLYVIRPGSEVGL